MLRARKNESHPSWLACTAAAHRGRRHASARSSGTCRVAQDCSHLSAQGAGHPAAARHRQVRHHCRKAQPRGVAYHRSGQGILPPTQSRYLQVARHALAPSRATRRRLLPHFEGWLPQRQQNEERHNHSLFARVMATHGAAPTSGPRREPKDAT